MADDEYPSLAAATYSAHFLEAATEHAYRDWQVVQSVPFVRFGLTASLANWVAVSLLLPIVTADWMRPVLALWIVQGPLLALSRLFLTSDRQLRRVPVVIGALNASSGLLMIWVPGLIGMGDLAVPDVAIIAFFGFAVFRLRPLVASLSVGTYALACVGLLSSELWAGTLPTARFVVDLALIVVSFQSGLLTNIAIDRSSRRAFRQERIIDSQRQTIALERARSEELLKKELSHQVAERSRELGAVLAKSDITFDVRALKTGERFAERYKIVAALGAGGMGAVYAVERVTDGEKLALKAVVGEVSGSSAARFAREAEIGARIRHPNLISIVDVGVSSGVPFLVMELVRGGSLEAQRARFGDVAWALPILRQIAAGLAALHEAGVVHRDLKPANVLLADGGVAKISDFGISRFGALDEGASIDPSGATMAATPKKSAELTGTGVVMGTPLYMAPEGAKSARTLDASADVFAFGIIAYEMLTGRSPFPVPAFMLAMAEQPIPVPPAIDDLRVPTLLRDVVLAALAGEPARRPRVRAIVAALM